MRGQARSARPAPAEVARFAAHGPWLRLSSSLGRRPRVSVCAFVDQHGPPVFSGTGTVKPLHEFPARDRVRAAAHSAWPTPATPSFLGRIFLMTGHRQQCVRHGPFRLRNQARRQPYDVNPGKRHDRRAMNQLSSTVFAVCLVAPSAQTSVVGGAFAAGQVPPSTA